ncbi:hypothetical protein KKF84_09340 [Myxococcota bacterium]|nr:hypothetical protein [Myxococcota bacterium]MBU1535513.1 hypothetical protein [Myxococcota bacterium]
MKKLLSTLILVSLFALAACDDDSTSDGMTPDTFIAQTPELMCGAVQDCCLVDGEWTNTDYVDYADCVEDMQMEIGQDFENDRMTVNESKLADTYSDLNGMINRDCTDEISEAAYWQFLADYTAAFEPAQAISEPCDDDEECMGTSVYCHFEGDAETGVCANLVALGGDCSNDERCVEDTYCLSDYELGTGECSNYVALDGDCSNGEYCEDGARCGDEYVCIENLQVGDACEDLEYYPNCYSGDDLYCDEEAGTCKATLPGGSECTMDEMCQSWECDTETGTCVDDSMDTVTVEDWVCGMSSEDQTGTGTVK